MIYLFIFASIILSILIPKYIIKYATLRIKGKRLTANIVDFKPAKLDYGQSLVLTYLYSDKTYEQTSPITAGWSVGSSYNVGDEVTIFINRNNPNECVVLSDFDSILYVSVTIFFYSLTVYKIIGTL